MKLYLAGPMSGHDDMNFPAFNHAAGVLRDQGYEVINPAELDDGNMNLSRAYCMSRDLPEVLNAEALAVLAGWEHSIGARLEVAAARVCDKPIFAIIEDRLCEMHNGEMESKLQRRSPVRIAYDLVHGDRQKAYGHPLDDFSRTAAMWTAYLGHHIHAEQVAACMMLVKISRLAHDADSFDSIIDAAGYAETYWMARKKRKAAEGGAR